MKTLASRLSLTLCIPLAVSSCVSMGRDTISCVARGTWTCTEQGICIDSARSRGEYFRFNLESMEFRNHYENGLIRSVSRDENGARVLNLGDGKRMVFNQRSFVDNLGASQDVSQFYFDGYSSVELSCPAVSHISD